MKIRILSVAVAAFLMLPFFCVTAYAGGDGNTGASQQLVDITPRSDAPAATVTVVDSAQTDDADSEELTAQPEPSSDTPAQRPFTPSGTGTVVDNATGEDGKEFFTITTPDENVFYLVIDRQRGAENVYFLNAVTEADLLSLAKMPEQPTVDITKQPTDPAVTEPEPEPQPEKNNGGGMMIFVLLAVIIGGGAAYYFKIYRPKQQANSAEDYDEAEADNYESEYTDDWQEADDAGDDSPPWDEDEE